MTIYSKTTYDNL